MTDVVHIELGITSVGEVASAAYLCDARALDGHLYLLYAGSTEVSALRGRGRGLARLGVARTPDLDHWQARTERDRAPAVGPPARDPTSLVPAARPATGCTSMVGWLLVGAAALVLPHRIWRHQ